MEINNINLKFGGHHMSFEEEKTISPAIDKAWRLRYNGLMIEELQRLNVIHHISVFISHVLLLQDVTAD